MIKDIPYIQKCILSRLIGATGAKYSEIKIVNLENDLYNYHLQELVKKGFIGKNINKEYCLSEAGIKLICEDYPLNQYEKEKEKFRANITTIILKKEKGKNYIHLHKRKRHPYFGDISTTGGSIQKNEKLEDAAKRTIKEEIGLNLKSVKVIGLVKITFIYKKKLFFELFLYLAISKSFTGELIKENKFGENYWDDIRNYNNIIKYNKSKLSKTATKLINSIGKGKRTPKFTFAEETIELNAI